MSDLPPDVRDRAATAARAAWLNASAPVAETWPAVVDAVAEVLAAEQPERESYEETIAVLSDPDAMEAIREGQEGVSDEFRSGPAEARVVELEEKAEHWRQRWENRNEHVDLISCDRDALKARVEELEARVRNLQVENVELSCQLDSAEEAVAAALAQGEKL